MILPELFVLFLSKWKIASLKPNFLYKLSPIPVASSRIVSMFDALRCDTILENISCPMPLLRKSRSTNTIEIQATEGVPEVVFEGNRVKTMLPAF